jgi:hypothetical protein
MLHCNFRWLAHGLEKMPDLLGIGSMRVELSPITLRNAIFAILQKAVAVAQRNQFEEFVSQIEDELALTSRTQLNRAQPRRASPAP